MTGNSNRNHKGFRREAESEGSGMGSSGLRNTNRIRGTWLGKRRGGMNRPNRIGHPELGSCICGGYVELEVTRLTLGDLCLCLCWARIVARRADGGAEVS